MRYHFEKPDVYDVSGINYRCDHIVYNRCTLYIIGNKGLAVIQQRYDEKTKNTYWTEVDPWLTTSIYVNDNFKSYFEERAGLCINGLYPTVTVRQIMHSLKMKPLKKELWETTFDRRSI